MILPKPDKAKIMKKHLPFTLLAFLLIAVCALSAVSAYAGKADEEETDAGGFFDEGFDSKDQIAGQETSFFEPDEDEEKIDGKVEYEAAKVKTAAGEKPRNLHDR